MKILLPLGVALVAFLIDVKTPDGVADGYLYLFAVLACQWLPGANAAMYTAAALMPTMLAGFFLCPAGSPLGIACVNRLVAMCLIWLAALAARHHARSLADRETALLEAQAQLNAAHRQVQDERAGLSNWLRDNIGSELDAVEWRLNRLWRRAPGLDPKTEAFVLQRAIQRTRYSLRGQAAQLLDLTLARNATQRSY